MRSLFLLAGLAAASTTSACRPQPVASSFTAADSAAIDSLYTVFRLAYRDLEAARVVDLYREDALYGSTGSPGFTLGRPPIAENFESFFRQVAADSAYLELRFRFLRRFRQDDLASDVGFYHLRSMKGDSGGKPSIGKFVTVLQRDSAGAWRFALDTYSDASLAAFDSAPAYEP